MPESFIHEATAARIVFGVGRIAAVPEEIARIGARPLVISDPAFATLAEGVVAGLEGEAAGLISEVRRHVPAASAEAAREQARGSAADCLVCIGGGSAIGLAKAVALTEGLPIVAVPTTYAGSEVTPVWGTTEDGVKTTGRDPVVAPRTVVYDPELTYSMPAELTAASGLNALAHCVDALWAAGRTPLTDTFAEHGVVELSRALPAAVRDGSDPEARSGALIGAWLAGTSFAIAGTSVHHRLCHALGGRFDLPHAETHAVVLPYVAELLLPAVPSAAAILARAFEAEPVGALRALAVELGAPTRLADLGLDLADALALADDIDPDALGSPRPLSREDLRSLLLAATEGEGGDA